MYMRARQARWRCAAEDIAFDELTGGHYTDEPETDSRPLEADDDGANVEAAAHELTAGNVYEAPGWLTEKMKDYKGGADAARLIAGVEALLGSPDGASPAA